ncbi:hypothetical protein A6770_18745 [Nostoc minutum NIES-26]|uniref:Uncharacterized protein n=1 Tax=Nostoc minutum NIES-26 TaxID=1844469 RepID=A0A367RA97_9NOSO|nr:hypothetical protein A6770_18745 [Nostoc minutum NIES-26]
MNKPQELEEAWDALMGINRKHYVSTGFYTLGDAFLISNKDPNYKNKVVLVEHRLKSQINHWTFTCDSSFCSNPIITSNGDDGNGNLKRKAQYLKVFS